MQKSSSYYERSSTQLELSEFLQTQLDLLYETLRNGLELAGKVLNSGRWNVYKNLKLARKMEKLGISVSPFFKVVFGKASDYEFLKKIEEASFLKLK